ncbi:unnamed protein product [Tetraodon nigroviridis]|uniref:(spotted green pufferfish) hypothetical protein n=1 Tax=Tetraodon nigroviridis TaxID=99883 RepID=Q4RKV8_TETNG|nr:unnamed protein product [Tetraodon nigroviridis]
MDGDAPGMGCMKGLYHKLGKRKCEGNRVMEYVSGARGFGLFCGRLH